MACSVGRATFHFDDSNHGNIGLAGPFSWFTHGLSIPILCNASRLKGMLNFGPVWTWRSDILESLACSTTQNFALWVWSTSEYFRLRKLSWSKLDLTFQYFEIIMLLRNVSISPSPWLDFCLFEILSLINIRICPLPKFVKKFYENLKIPAQSTSYHPKYQLIPLINNIANTHSWLHDSYHTFLHYAFIRFSFFPVFFCFVSSHRWLPLGIICPVPYSHVGVSLASHTGVSSDPIIIVPHTGPLLVSALSAGRVLTRHGPHANSKRLGDLNSNCLSSQVRPAQLSAAMPGRASPAYHHPSLESWINYWFRLT